jgi:polysaccharide export outer membrane protein
VLPTQEYDPHRSTACFHRCSVPPSCRPANLRVLSMVALRITILALVTTISSVAQSPTTGTRISPEAQAVELAQPAPSAKASAVGLIPGPNTDSIISPDDVLDVYIVDVPELSRQYRVSPAGKVQVPLLTSPILAAGGSVTQFAEAIADELRKNGLVNNPHVTVSIASSRLQSVAITGAVRRPQIYPIFGATTLLDILSQAEGLTEDAGNSVIIARGELGPHQNRDVKQSTVTVDLKRLLESSDARDNVMIYPGDRLTVPRAGVVYVVGAVNKPGGFVLKSPGEGLTVLQALALAEYLTSTAVGSKAEVIRVDQSGPGGRKRLPVDLKRILAGKAEDRVLRANDILFVPQSTGAKAFRRGLEAVLQTASGAVIYRTR